MQTITNYIGIIGLLLAFFTACTEKKDLGSFEPLTPEFSIETNTINVGKEGGEYLINVESNLPWRARSNADWISFKSENALADGAFTFEVTRNRTTEPRVAEIIVWVTKEHEKTLQVVQAPSDPSDLATHYYVKTDGSETNSGLSWADAIPLQKALDEMVNGDVIHIAAGTYLPSKTISGGSAANTGDITFEIHSNVTLIGGYPADAADGAIANPQVNPTILSGNTPAGRVYHTVAITAPLQDGQQVVLEGLSIKHGRAAASGTGSISVSGVPFYRFYGGGLIIGRSTVDVINCEISDNESGLHAGGVYIAGGGTVRFDGSAIRNNRATTNSSNGGGIFIDASTVYFNNCEVSGNMTTGVGAGIYAFNATQPTYTYIYNTTVANNNNNANNVNETRRGGGFYAREHSVSVIVNSTFYGNTGGHGAGISLYGTATGASRMTIISSTITRNNAYNNGGGVEITANTTLNVFNTIISGNQAANGNDVYGNGSDLSYSVLGSRILDANGDDVPGQSFDAETMLGHLADNGGETKTSLLTASSPAATLGMTASALEALGATLTPAITPEVIASDQNGKSRTGKTAMGAAIP